eukprot:TRINITY_DN77007_c0_g1_i1.p1 TRINITY_DN77007_c0_g1~~TRINITY_DN77007_c0_g1_i1.p1  ORF type:complete len:422 (-),score=71.34 TRINITY_DN77007_c0_g1_i1:76-1341(-)
MHAEMTEMLLRHVEGPGHGPKAMTRGASSKALWLAEEPPQKVNYRSIGRGSGGVVRRRIPLWEKDFDPPTASSMPTKYETVFFKDNKEKRGFGGHTPRFAEQRTSCEEVPGPGAYSVAPQEDSHDAEQRPRSARGKGTFASRTPRIPHSARSQGGFVPPGPGTYEVHKRELMNALEKPTAAFVQAGAGNPAKFFPDFEPGPGTYLGPDDGLPLPAGWSRGCGFGESQRSEMIPSEDTPGPGSYTMRSSEETARMLTTGGKWSSRRKLVAADDKAQTEGQQLRRGAELLKDDDTRGKVELGDRDRGGFVDTRTSANMPGPGEYTPRMDLVKGQSHHSARGHSSFQVGTSHQPRTWRPPEPGPGQYDPEAQVAKPPYSPLSTMRSETKRFKKPVAGAPGPAYYRPTPPPGTVSFHLNFQKIWT